ncbi:MAG: penicillin-binding protein 1C, partial [candidate division Zixibacteria bacterium]|nr:penicillin-binding protein 1C [candidate division Zixibacteria bacterium]
DRNGELLNCYASDDHFWRLPTEIDSISPLLIKTVLNTEDKWYRYHPGVNPVSLLKAAVDNVQAGKIVRGGSTITMQIARMMEPKPRNIGGKLIEIFRALQLEMHYSKDELLEIYFNLIPYGGNIEGVGAAAYFYFGKSPSELTVSESAILAGIPSSPNNYRPDRNPEKCRKRRNRILRQLNINGIIDEDKYHDALEEEIPKQRGERPDYAPHFSQSMMTRIDSEIGDGKIRSTLDLKIQALCERLAVSYANVLAEKDIHNLSIVVIDNKSGRLLAMVGSPDFNDRKHQGQINGAFAPRSPGSALKPFVYALGFENGMITPSSNLDDIPVSYAGYSPENYDEKYNGVVTVSEALIRSLNVPAVNLTSALGIKKFYRFLQDGGISTLAKKYNEYGLPLVLGACEVSLIDLANLYAALGRNGIYRPLIMLDWKVTTKAADLLSPEASYLVCRILSNLQRPNLPSSWEFTRDLPTIAWKTGTSYGRRDAWAIGYNPLFTVGVWAGNFSGEGSPWLVGAESAAPLMFSVFNEIMQGHEHIWFEMPEGIGRRKVCAVSGMPPNSHCPNTVNSFYIKGLTNIGKCTIHKSIIVDRNSGYELCRACLHLGKPDTLIVEDWPVRLSGWLSNHSGVTHLPKHHPGCTGIFADGPPQIISPEDGTHFEISKSIPSEYQKIMFEASSGLRNRKLYWFLDDRLFGSCGVDAKMFYEPSRGSHTLMCVDDLGRSTKINFTVR